MKFRFFVFLIVLCSSPAFSQSLYREKYMDAAGSSVLLFSGKAAPHYPYRYTNSHYAYSDAYQPGILYFDGIRYEGVLMNLDVCAGCLCVRETLISMPVALEKENVTGFSYGGHRFLNMGGDGYVEVLGESSEVLLLKKMKKIPTDDLHTVSVVHYFQNRDSYWLIRMGEKYRVSSENTFCKLFPGKKHELKSVWKSLDNTRREDLSRSYSELFKVISGE